MDGAIGVGGSGGGVSRDKKRTVEVARAGGRGGPGPGQEVRGPGARPRRAPPWAPPLGRVGWLVDRYRRRPFFVAANLRTTVLLSPLLAVRDRADVWITYVVAALYGLSYITLSAVLSGLIRHLVPSELLADANGVLQTVRQGLRPVGPLAGAGLYAAVGGWLLVALAMTGFLTAVGLVGLLRGHSSPWSG